MNPNHIPRTLAAALALLVLLGGRPVRAQNLTLDNFPANMGANTVVPIHPPNQVSPALNDILNDMPSSQADEIRNAVTGGLLTIGRINLGPGNYGFHDQDTIGLQEGQDGELIDGPALWHEWTHTKNAIAANAANDPTMIGPCGAKNHAIITVIALNTLCELTSSPGATAAEVIEGCKDWKDLSNSNATRINKAQAAAMSGACTTPAAVPSTPSCPACP